MDWAAKGFQPGFPELVIQHLGAAKEEKVLQTLAFAKIFSLVKLRSLTPSGEASAMKRKIWTAIQGISTRYRRPSPLEEVINGIMKVWAVTRFPNLAPAPKIGPKAPTRTLTLREASALTKNPQPLFIKTIIRTPSSKEPGLPPRLASAASNAAPPLWQDTQLSQSSNLSMGSFSQPKRSYIPRKIFLRNTPSRKRPAPAEPPLIANAPYIEILATATNKNPSLWEVSLLFRDESKTFASSGRTSCPIEVTK